MIHWISELRRVQPNNNSINAIFVQVGVRGRKLKAGAACSQVKLEWVFLGGMREANTSYGLFRIFRKNRMSASSMIS